MTPSEPGKTDPAVMSPPESLLARFAAVWIWTVFFGVNGGLSYSFLTAIRELSQIGMMGRGVLPGSRFTVPIVGQDAVVLPVAYAAGLLASVAAWLFLYLYFVTFVLPVVLLGTQGPHEDRRRRLAAAYLNRCYQLLILAGLARATPELVYLFLPAFGWFGLP